MNNDSIHLLPSLWVRWNPGGVSKKSANFVTVINEGFPPDLNKLGLTGKNIGVGGGAIVAAAAPSEVFGLSSIWMASALLLFKIIILFIILIIIL